MSVVSRRRFLGLISGACAGAAALTRAPAAAWAAISPASQFRVARLDIPGILSTPRPNAIERLAWEVEKSTSIDVNREELLVRPQGSELHQSPFLMLVGDRPIPPLPGPARAAISRFLTAGGFLLIDSAEGRPDGPFERSVRNMLQDILPRPEHRLKPLSSDHVVYKSFYLLDRPYGRVMAGPALEGIEYDSRAAVVYCPNDLSGAWARDDLGNWSYECYPGGQRQRELSFRLGTNLVMYSLCLDYKTDQVHVPFILKRRQWKTP